MFWLLPTAFANAPIPSLEWDWSESTRFLIETEVGLPSQMLFRARLNKQVRVVGFQLQVVLDCIGSNRLSSSRREEVLCFIEEASLVAGTHPGDRGRALPILEEFADVLTGTTLRMVIRNDGRVVAIDLPELKARNFRARTRNETLRLIARFAAMGFELPLTSGGDDAWVTSQSLVCSLPSAGSGPSPIEGVHTALVRSGDLVELASHGRGLISALYNANTYTCETTSRALVEPSKGAVRHTWEMLAEPTPSSPAALGAAGTPYTQKGGLRRLTRDEVVVLQDTREIELQDPGMLPSDLPPFDVER